VRLHDVAHDGEAEARGPELAARRRLREALEDALTLLERDAGAGVFAARASMCTRPPRGV
jgi:hypothetical protein